MTPPKFGPKLSGEDARQSLMNKRVLVSFGENKRLIGKLGRNSFSNRTLCLTTGDGEEDLYGKFFFEPEQPEWIKEIMPA